MTSRRHDRPSSRRTTAGPSGPTVQRCAIYTRKSTEHNLDLAFNSLDAQREACEAYVKSQAHEGWRLIADRFDDGGLSGASLERPALQALLDQVRQRRVDVIVVYKVDRLTRSLADFAKLVELFDAHGVCFVSVTQSFNTTSSMGRLTLNVLLSFAQFEREVIGERVRDKIAASKRKGLWVGGPVPLGYRSRDKALEVVPEEADLVRRIFGLYRDLGSAAAVAAQLNGEGLKPKPRRLSNGQMLQAACYRVGPLAHLLRNRFYIGEIVCRGEVHVGTHEPILDRDLFEAVQARLDAQAAQRRTLRSRTPAPLAGLLFDAAGHAMSPSHASKAGVRYRYYVSQALLQGRREDAGAVARVSAPEIEAAVLAAMRARPGTGPDKAPAAPSKPSPHEAARASTDTDDIQRGLALVDRVTLHGDRIVITWRPGEAGAASPAPLTVPFRKASCPRKGVAHEPVAHAADPRRREALLAAIVRARGWIDDLVEGRAGSFEEIAAREDKTVRHVRRLSVLAFLSPQLAAAIVRGATGPELTIASLTSSLPMAWADQDRAFLADR